MEGGQAGGVGGLRYPEAEVAAAGVFFCHVFQKALVVLFFVQLRIVGKAVLDCAAHYGGAVNEAVCFRYNFSVDAAGFVGAGCAVVLHCLGHGFNLFRSEEWGAVGKQKTLQKSIFPEYSSR